MRRAARAGYAFLLLEEARRAEALQRSLILCLRRLQGLPGYLALDVASVLRNALTNLDWSEQLADDRDIIHQHAAQLASARTGVAMAAPGAVSGVARLWWPASAAPHSDCAATPTRSSARHRLHRDPHPEPAGLRAATDQADAAADVVAEDRRLSDDSVRHAMATVDGSLRRRQLSNDHRVP